jgi:hypothetical protein
MSRKACALALECRLTESSLRAVRQSLYRLIAESHGVLGEPEVAVIVLDGAQVAAALDRLADRLQPAARAD